MSIVSALSSRRRNASAEMTLSANLTAELAELRQRDERLLQVVSDLIDGKFDSIKIESDDHLSEALSKLASLMRQKSSERLDRIVELSMQGSETAISSARLLSTSRAIDTSSQALASASEEMVASIGQIRTTASSADSSTSAMDQSAKRGRSTVDAAITMIKRAGDTARQASERITELSRTSEAIGSIVGSIDAVAKQTNLLALNATIEAARAGSAGKGFAVVAAEVKNLSNQTSVATEEIKGRIEKLQAEIAASVNAMVDCTKAAAEGENAMSGLAEVIVGVEENASNVAHGMGEISSILNQQAEAAQEVAKGISDIAAMTRKNVEQVLGISGQLDLAQKCVARELVELSELSFDRKIVRLAKADHVIWKKRLADMAVGRETLKAAELADHRSCRLGKWYYSDAAAEFRDRAEFQALESPHALVHEHGKRAAALFESGDLIGALAEIEKVDHASKDVIALLGQLA